MTRSCTLTERKLFSFHLSGLDQVQMKSRQRTWVCVVVSVVFKTYVFQLSYRLKAVKAVGAAQNPKHLHNQIRI